MDIDTIETVITDRGTYKVHTDCYEAIRKQAQKQLIKDLIDENTDCIELNEIDIKYLLEDLN